MENRRTDLERYIQEKYLGKELCEAVVQMDAGQLSDLLTLVMNRWRQIYPDTEFIWFSLSKVDKALRRRTLKQAWDMMMKECPDLPERKLDEE